MPVPIAPAAAIVLRAAALSLAAYAVLRARQAPPRIQPVEDAMDDLPEGTVMGHDRDGGRAAMRWRRTFRAGPDGPGIEVDLAALARLRLRRVP